MNRHYFALVFFLIVLSAPIANAFQFSAPAKGEKVFAGSTIKVRIEPGDIDPLFGVMLNVSPAGIIKSTLDSTMPFEWSIKIPAHFHGPLRLEAVGRRYVAIPNPPRATRTLIVMLPAISISNRVGPVKE